MNTKSQLILEGGSAMDPEPVNVGFDFLVQGLNTGRPMVAQLEPGDGTHYCLLIVPAWADSVAAHLGRYGIMQSRAGDYLIVTKLNDADGETCYACADGVGTWDLGGIKNPWTKELLAWWLDLLWAEVKKARS